jgi:hypothetical protein
VVVASAILELRVRQVNAGTDWRGNPKVERCVPYAREPAGRDERRINRCVAVSVNGQHVPQNVSLAFTGQVEIGVL